MGVVFHISSLFVLYVQNLQSLVMKKFSYLFEYIIGIFPMFKGFQKFFLVGHENGGRACIS